MDRHNRNLFGLLLTPSWVSGICGALLACAVTIGLLFEGQYEGSDLQRQYLTWRTTEDSMSVSSAASTLQHSTADVVAGIQLFIFWFAVGTLIYLIIAAIYRIVQSANQTRASLQYVNIDRAAYVRGVYRDLALRFASLIVWVGYTIATLKFIGPYILGAIHIADEHYPSLGSVVIIAAAGLCLFTTFHLHVIMLRLLIGRPRLFQDSEYLIRSVRQL